MNQLMHDMHTIEIIYIGPKAFKRDTVTGYRPQMTFKRFDATPVPATVAIALLDFPDCFVRASKETIEKAESLEKAAIIAAELEAEELAVILEKEKDDQDTTVEVDGETIDLVKYTFSQLEAFCLAGELEITRGEGEEKPLLVKRIRDAYRSKGE